MADDMNTPDEWEPVPVEGPHDHKGNSEEKCVRCGWVMGHRPLNCMNDNTPHRFPSQETEIERLRIRCNFVADENDEMHNDLMRLLREIERLRAAGDQLAYHVRAENAKEMYTAVRIWEEARRG